MSPPYTCRSSVPPAGAYRPFNRPKGRIGPTRLEAHGLVEHHDRFWTIADGEHTITPAGHHSAPLVDELDGGFFEVTPRMVTAVERIKRAVTEDEKSTAVGVVSEASYRVGNYREKRVSPLRLAAEQAAPPVHSRLQSRGAPLIRHPFDHYLTLA